MKDDRDLLFTDICARLKYNVKVRYKCFHVHSVKGLTSAGLIVLRDETDKLITTDIKNIQPYLFPLSSMTEEIMDEIYNNTGVYDIDIDSSIHIEVGTTFEDLTKISDILHKHHVDYRGLIPMGLAIDATGKNIY